MCVYNIIINIAILKIKIKILKKSPCGAPFTKTSYASATVGNSSQNQSIRKYNLHYKCTHHLTENTRNI